jgi:ABC-type polysaccharide/polyol phosphate transport system, ATPase component
MRQMAVVVDDVSKKFRLYHERNQTLKSAVMRGRTSRHDEFWALKNVSFDVEAGQTYGIIGSNGSGKSTLLKCLAKIYWPTSGSIHYNGKNGLATRSGLWISPGALWPGKHLPKRLHPLACPGKN